MLNKETLYFFADELEKSAKSTTSIHDVYTGLRNLFSGSAARATKPHPSFKQWQKNRKIK